MSENITINYNNKVYNLKEVKEYNYYKLVNDKNEVSILYSPGHTAVELSNISFLINTKIMNMNNFLKKL
jgi:hypothetical protein